MGGNSSQADLFDLAIDVRVVKLSWQPVGRRREAALFQLVNRSSANWASYSMIPRLRSAANVTKLSLGLRGALSEALSRPDIIAEDRELRLLVFEEMPLCKTLDKFPLQQEPNKFLLVLYTFLRCEWTEKLSSNNCQNNI